MRRLFLPMLLAGLTGVLAASAAVLLLGRGTLEFDIEGAHNHGLGWGLRILVLLRRYPPRCGLDGAIGHPDL